MVSPPPRWNCECRRSCCLASPGSPAGNLRNARQASGCGELKLHSLRHYYASGLIAAGGDVVTVQRALGHGSATITLDIYAHPWPTAEDKTRAAAAR